MSTTPGSPSLFPSLRGWVWFVRRFGVREAFFYWMAGRRQGWMTHDEFVDFIETRGKG